MGCVHSKRKARSVAAASPAFDFPISNSLPLSGLIRSNASSRNQSGILNYCHKRKGGGIGNECSEDGYHHYIFCNRSKWKGRGEPGKRAAGTISINGIRLEEAVQVAAGWPAWLSSAAGEAINGWVPLQADSYEKLEKIGQGTYSSVFRAREVETGRIVALKKVRFDNYHPESIRFMAREIIILRTLDHPNIVKLDGIITSRQSNSIYLVFEYLEHDLAGLLSNPDIKFTEPQIKCYMKQLLCGLEHCHSKGVMHRDIKSSNILVNNEGILKLADFGLANILDSKNRQQLTSRVVTLWYRPPELLMGSTSYSFSVDLWSVGCVLVELFTGKPPLKGRTEVEQLHKIFKLCGSPPEDYWKQSKLPNATMFRPQHTYDSSLQFKCKDLPTAAVDLIETMLSVEPEKRGNASSALMSKYLNTMPFACEPSSLPKYEPNKEINAKHRNDLQRKKLSSRSRGPNALKRLGRSQRAKNEHNGFTNIKLKEERKVRADILSNANTNEGNKRFHQEQSNTPSSVSQANYNYTGPPLRPSSGFAWAKKGNDDVKTTVSCDQSVTASQLSALDSSRFNFANNSVKLVKEEKKRSNSISSHLQQSRHRAQHSFDVSDTYRRYDFSPSRDVNDPQKEQDKDYIHTRQKIEFSGPVMPYSDDADYYNEIDNILHRNENQIRHAAHRSRFDRGKEAETQALA